MGLSKLFLTSATVGGLALVAVSAHAQHRGGGRNGGDAAVGRAVPRAPGPAMVAPRRVFAPRATMAPRFGPSRFGTPAFATPRFGAARFAGSRTLGVGPRPAFAPRGVIATRGFAGRRGFSPRAIGPRIIVSPFRFSRPFYSFRPRFSLGFGLWAGFPIAYPYYSGYPYAYPYAYPYPYVSAYPYSYPAYGYPDPSYSYPAAPYPAPYPAQTYPPSGSVGAQQGQNSGGVSFEIVPNTAGVYVDTTYVGTVAEFSPTTMPLTLTPGRHHIELRVAGYQTMAFDMEVVAGQVIPYRGEMQPQR